MFKEFRTQKRKRCTQLSMIKHDLKKLSELHKVLGSIKEAETASI